MPEDVHVLFAFFFFSFSFCVWNTLYFFMFGTSINKLKGAVMVALHCVFIAFSFLYFTFFPRPFPLFVDFIFSYASFSSIFPSLLFLSPSLQSCPSSWLRVVPYSCSSLVPGEFGSCRPALIVGHTKDLCFLNFAYLCKKTCP